MSNTFLFFSAILLIFSGCVNQKKIIIRPEPAPVQPVERQEPGQKPPPVESAAITESQNGPAGAGIPEWVNYYLNGGIPALESLYAGKYVFIGENRGGNFTALRQWAAAYTAAQDFPRLLTRRVEQRMVAAAVLYPDDEYGDYFSALIRAVANAEYSGAVKEDSFWVKRRKAISDETAAADAVDEAFPPETAAGEPYEFFVLISIDKMSLQSRLRGILGAITTASSPSREQTAAINRIRNAFFEGF